MAMPKEGEESWPFTHRECGAIAVVLPVPLPTAVPRCESRQGRALLFSGLSCASARSRQLQAGRGLVQPSGRSVRPWKGILRGAAALCAPKSSPPLAVLSCGELVLGVEGVSRTAKRPWPRRGAVLLVLSQALNYLILAGCCSTRG